MIEIKEIQFDECLDMWKKLWASRVSPIEPTSAMIFNESDFSSRAYSSNIKKPVFLGAFVNGVLAGVNSFHEIDSTTRSRGLYVDPTYRGNKIGELLLRETILRSPSSCWSFPKQEALSTYLRAGFKQASEIMYDSTEEKYNCYVMALK